jgi:hypothetical protein
MLEAPLSENFAGAFLIIGSMKSGTSSVFDDVVKHPSIFKPAVKEPDDLVSDAVLSKKGRTKYAQLFHGARKDQWIGEASTAYTKHPKITGVPERARSLFGSDVRLIFIGRDPLERLRSHYRHEVQNGEITQPLQYILERHEWPELEQFSAYDEQLQQWLDVFDRRNILVLRMADYVSDPTSFVNRIFRFIGVSSIQQAGGFEVGQTANASAGKRQPRGILRSIMYSDFTQRKLKKLMPRALRQALQRALIPKGANSFEDTLSPEMKLALQQRLEQKTEMYCKFAKEDEAI